MAWNTVHCWHIFIFLRQLSWTLPLQNVPLMNQQRCPAQNSQAGQFRFVSTEHLCISQQGLALLGGHFFMAKRKRACLSMCVGTFLQPCSKLWTAFGETPNNCAIWPCVFPRYRRILENSFLSIDSYPPDNSVLTRLSPETRIIPQCGIQDKGSSR